jgi:hypothetical protein
MLPPPTHTDATVTAQSKTATKKPAEEKKKNDTLHAPTLNLERGAWDAHARLEFCRELGFLNEAGPGCSEAHVDLGADTPPDPQVYLMM